MWETKVIRARYKFVGEKVPIFAKRTALSQPPVNATVKRDTTTSRLSCSQPNSERPSSPKREVHSSSGERESTPPFNSKNKIYWYREYKHQKGIVRRLTKDLERSNTKLRKISKTVKVLSVIV